jgi:hypothetical protein
MMAAAGEQSAARLFWGECLQRFEQFAAIDGFSDIAVATGVDASFKIAQHGLGGQGDYWFCITGVAQTSSGLVSVHDRHLHVH